MSSITPIDIIFDSDQVDTSTNVTGVRDRPIFTLQPAIENCVGVALLYANVPFTYYVIDNTNNHFGLESAGVYYDCTIAPGTYNSVNIASQVIDALARASVPNFTHYAAFVDNTDSKFVMYKTSNVHISFKLDFVTIPDNQCFRVLGFEQAIYTSTTATFNDNAENVITNTNNIKSPRVVNLSGPGQMFLASDFGPTIYGKVRNQTSKDALIGFWPVNSNYQGTIEYSREDPPRITMSRTTVSKIQLKLLLGNRTQYAIGDNQVEYLPLNGEAFQVGLRFFVLESEENQSYDSVGNSVISLQNKNRSSVYQPTQLTQNSIKRIRM